MRKAAKSKNGGMHSNDRLREDPKHREAKMPEFVRMESRENQRESIAVDAEFREVSGEEKRQLIAEAAYYRAERRSFTPGNELMDWLDAEAEIEKMLSQMDKGKMHRSA